MKVDVCISIWKEGRSKLNESNCEVEIFYGTLQYFNFTFFNNLRLEMKLLRSLPQDSRTHLVPLSLFFQRFVIFCNDYCRTG